ncbi:hypothetical protein BCR33DRAFT_772588 [Rhizoclosmatium globosum]|uniref:C2H2-type domain-containing protein n=1 Tax=Rhizoclosmatium globosum TaxID=329046 RepID=A0A1Y2B3H8_9FUNG|nr:hypothetical protein BCR33DRAFT_772588 [Rhizoclosmatium globosum]|eukprot:ORY29284.1 hypothetical protein BCR33DRAFT_772588 [Rhizoclosmatium globosum]
MRANICVDCGSQFKWPQDLKKHCIKLEHTYIVPESKGKPGPSPVYVEETEDGGHSIVRYGPSLNGGRQKTYQRCSAPEGSTGSASVTHGLVTSNPNDKSQGNTTQTEVTVSVTKIEEEPKTVVEPIKLSPSLPERLPGIQALMAKEECNNSSRTNTTIQYQAHSSMYNGAYSNEGIVDYDHSRSYLPSPKSEHHRRMNTPNQHLESWNKPPVYVPTVHQQRYDHHGYQHQRNPLFQETNYQPAYANHEAYGASSEHVAAPSHIHPHVQHVSYSSHWYHFGRQPCPPSFEEGVQSNAHEEYYSRQQQHHHATAPRTVSSPLHNPRHGGHHDVYPFQNEDSRAGYHIPQYINAQRC